MSGTWTTQTACTSSPGTVTLTSTASYDFRVRAVNANGTTLSNTLTVAVTFSPT